LIKKLSGSEILLKLLRYLQFIRTCYAKTQRLFLKMPMNVSVRIETPLKQLFYNRAAKAQKKTLTACNFTRVNRKGSCTSSVSSSGILV